jgi:hypothetical protein
MVNFAVFQKKETIGNHKETAGNHWETIPETMAPNICVWVSL